MFLESASELGKQTDGVFLVVTGVVIALLVIITALMVWFALRYRKSRNPVPTDIEGHNALEISWTIGGIVLVLYLFYLGVGGYRTLTEVPEDAMPVEVTARMWSWHFAYPNGKESDRLIVPAGSPVRLDMTSEDVLHSLYIPAFRVKQDVVPGATKTLWFTPDEAGTYDLFCAEYCGTGHSNMITTVEVSSREDFDAWYAEAAEVSGETLYKTKGCSGCHTTDGATLVGPTWKGLYGKEITVTTDGKTRTLTADEDYLERSITDPQADIVEGYPPVMPAVELTDEEVQALVDYIKTLE